MERDSDETVIISSYTFLVCGLGNKERYKWTRILVWDLEAQPFVSRPQSSKDYRSGIVMFIMRSQSKSRLDVDERLKYHHSTYSSDVVEWCEKRKGKKKKICLRPDSNRGLHRWG